MEDSEALGFAEVGKKLLEESGLGQLEYISFIYVEFKMPVIHTSRDVGKAICQKDEFEPDVTLV